MAKKVIAFLFCFSFISIQLCQATEVRSGCKLCGMYIESYIHTATTLVAKDGSQAQTCGVADMLRLINNAGGPAAFTTITVHNWVDKNEITAKSAVYVIGSKIIPDMLPNLIAFATKEEAELFQQENGGELLDFTQALLSISPTGMTMPARIKSAVIPARGATGIAIATMKMVMDEVMIGSDSVDPLEFTQRPAQTMMDPKKMESSAEMLMASFGLTDDLALAVKVGNVHKTMEMYGMMNVVSETKNNGISDIDISLRYGLWKNNMYSKFFSLLGGVTLPTGDFEAEYIDMSGLQIGTGDFTGTAGALFSQRINNFWFHYQLSYTYKLENSDDYKFGDVVKFGTAAHYTPNYDLMLGLELDGTEYAKNEKNGTKVENSGGFRSYVTAVGNYRFLTALGGNFNLKLSGSLPIYEDMNHYTSMGVEKVQLGGGYIASGMLSFKRRFAF